MSTQKYMRFPFFIAALTLLNTAAFAEREIGNGGAAPLPFCEVTEVQEDLDSRLEAIEETYELKFKSEIGINDHVYWITDHLTPRHFKLAQEFQVLIRFYDNQSTPEQDWEYEILSTTMFSRNVPEQAISLHSARGSTLSVALEGQNSLGATVTASYQIKCGAKNTNTR